MTRLLLVRHGETVDNVNQIMQGQTQGELTQKGVQQAEELAQQMADEQIDVFVSSDLKRSIDTCTIIAQSHGLPVVQTPLLRERDWGGFTGRFIPDLKDEQWPDDIETITDLRARAQAFLDFISEQYPGKTVLAVGHGIINKAIQAVHLGKEMREIPRMTNAE
ncbi:MAG: histidine phosphatase family protein, partial [Prevotella sp.]|nr:histidine phosphatase family protein [Prevotella sp.]